MKQDTLTALLTTVNAPYQTYLDGRALAAALTAGDITIGVTVPSLIRIAFKIIVCFQRHDVPLIFILYR